jgi:hypothetical protein
LYDAHPLASPPNLVSIIGIFTFRHHLQVAERPPTAASIIAARGVDPFAPAYYSVNSDIRMAMRYTHATNATMREAVRSLDRLAARLGNVSATKTKTAGTVPP